MPGLAGQSPNYRGMKIVTGRARMRRGSRRRSSPPRESRARRRASRAS
ncbi:hypothetical protein GSH04_26945, partial [Burkholderia pseudomallei]|nr:hypothetical protein [Burkholderia pseudomallei]